jgi:hypothetical protein
VVILNLTFMSWTILPNKARAKTCWALGGTVSFLVKLQFLVYN